MADAVAAGLTNAAMARNRRVVASRTGLQFAKPCDPRFDNLASFILNPEVGQCGIKRLIQSIGERQPANKPDSPRDIHEPELHAPRILRPVWSKSMICRRIWSLRRALHKIYRRHDIQILSARLVGQETAVKGSRTNPARKEVTGHLPSPSIGTGGRLGKRTRSRSPRRKARAASIQPTYTTETGQTVYEIR
jgi:hypothetical protein